MTFIQNEFVLFFLIVISLYWGLKKRTHQNILLLVASTIFYGWVHPWFLILLFSSAFLDFNMGRMMVKSPEKKSLGLTISMVGNLGMLGYF